ncbi:MAG: SPW repeat domain-containing protein [Mucilaginibacter sp.]
MKPFISTKFYGVMNYLIGAALILAPWFVPASNGKPFYVHADGASLLLPLIVGWVQLIMAFFSNNSHGVIRQFPLQMHFFLDVLCGSFLFASPFVYGFSDVIWWPHVLFGGLLVILGVFTKKSPFTTPTPHAQPQGGLTSVDYEEQTLMY